MRLQRSKLSFLINFLLGVAWALVILSLVLTIKNYMFLGFAISLVIGFLASLPSLLLVVILEYVLTGEEKLDEMKKQTKLLEELVAQENLQKDEMVILDK